jgi:hypothetical protein
MDPAEFILAAALLTLSGAAFAETADGNGALALSAIVGETSPLLSARDKSVLAKFLNGQTNVTYPDGQTISLTARKLTCLRAMSISPPIPARFLSTARP